MIAVGLCTYKRPQGLARVLEHLAKTIVATGQAVPVIVVDNDGRDPAVGEVVAAARAAHGVDVRLKVETTPGISAARNAVIAEADAIGARFLAMLDDDEWPSEDWLPALLRTQAAEQAVVVGGPVTPVFAANGEAMAPYARFWAVEPQFLDGKPFVFCTCNFLIDMAAARGVERPFFPPELGLSGSEDVTFFRRLFYLGHKMAWAADAVTFEEVPADRATIGWLRERKFGVGNHAVAWEARDKGKGYAWIKTAGVTARLIVYPLLGRERHAPLLGWLLMGEQVRGRWAAHLGRHRRGYARTATDGGPPAKACR